MCFLFFCLTFFSIVFSSPTGFNIVDHVVIIGLDGLHSETFSRSISYPIHAPTLSSLFNQSSSTNNSRSQSRASSAPNWASVLFATGTEFHGVHSNDWTLQQANVIPPSGPCTLPPNIFTVAHVQDNSIKNAIYYSWENLDPFLDSKHIHTQVYEECSSCGTCLDILPKFISNFTTQFKTHQFNISFIHIDAFDRCTSENGYFGDEILDVLKKIDDQIALIVKEIKDSQLDNKTLIMVVTDHGKDSHGGFRSGGFEMAQTAVPWFVIGPGVKQGYKLSWPISNIDTAPTALRSLGLYQPIEWRGRPVLDIYTGVETTKKITTVYGNENQWWTLEVEEIQNEKGEKCKAPVDFVAKVDYHILSWMALPVLTCCLGFAAGQGLRFRVMIQRWCFREEENENMVSAEEGDSGSDLVN